MTKREPNLKTVKMIEEFIKDNSGEYTRTEIWQHLPKTMMYQTFKTAFEYIKDSNKIIIEDRLVIWIYNPKLAKHLRERSVEV